MLGLKKPSWLKNSLQQEVVKHDTSKHPVSLVNGVYYPNWRIYRQQPPSSLPISSITHIFYAFAKIDPEGNIGFSDEWADMQMDVDGTKGCIPACRQLKVQNPKLKIIVSVGGGAASQHFAEMAHKKSSRLAFAHNARSFLNTHGLDGLDIDWEHPSDRTQGADYIHLLSDLRNTLPSKTYTLTSALPAGTWALKIIDPISKAARSLDFINLMTYDFSGPWVPTVGYHSQLFTLPNPPNDAAHTSCDSAVTYLLSQGVPEHKLLLGIPAYGRSFLGANRIGDAYSGHGGEEGVFEYRDLPRPGAREHVDPQAVAAYCLGGDGGFVTYDNVQTVREKARYVKRKELGGVFFWTGTGDRKAGGGESLVEASWQVLMS